MKTNSSEQSADTARSTPDRSALPDLTSVRRLIARVRSLLRSNWVVTGAGVTLALLFGTLVAASLLDLFHPLWPVFRLLALVSIVLPSTIAFFTGVVRPLFRRLSSPSVARRIETQLPGIHNRLVSVVDLDQQANRPALSTPFYHRLVSETLDRIRAFRPSQAVNFQNLRRSLVAAIVCIGAFSVAWSVFSDRLPTALARIFQPLADIPPVTDVAFTAVPGDLAILRRDRFLLGAEVIRGTPDKLQVEVVPVDGSSTLWFDLEPNEKEWSIELAGLDQSFDYRIHGGGTWTKKHRVTMVDRPEVVDLQVALNYPKYLDIPEPVIYPPLELDVSGPEGSAVELRIETAGDVTEGEIQLLQPQPKTVDVTDRVERVWFAESIPEGAGPEGTWEWDLRLLARAAHTDPANPGLHRHLFHNAPKPHLVRSGESLFAYVYVVPGQIPESIMLEWHDGQNWEHRAFWGADKVAYGVAGTASRRHMGDIPAAGEWVRLELPAASVELDNKPLKGMAFTLFGGQAIWHRCGTFPAATRIEHELVISSRIPLAQTASNQWGGRFSLQGTGVYRFELKNELGHSNQRLRDGNYRAIPDLSPQILVTRPGKEVVLSKPLPLPITIAAADDFGLSRVTLAIQPPGAGGFESQPIRRYPPAVVTDQFMYTLDLASWKLKPGDVLKYRLEAHDRKDQSRSTPEYVVRIQDDANAIDRRQETLEKQQEAIQQKLEQLVADQQKIEQQLQQLEQATHQAEQQLADLQAAEQAKQAEASASDTKPADPAGNDPKNENAPSLETKPGDTPPPAGSADPKPDQPKPGDQPPPSGSDPQPAPQPAPQPNGNADAPAANKPQTPAQPEMNLQAAKEQQAQQKAALQKELADLTTQQQKNAAAGQQLLQEVKSVADQSANLDLIPQPIQQQLAQFPDAFQKKGVQPLQQLAKDLPAANQPESKASDIAQVANDAEDVQRNLEELRDTFKALAKATKQSRTNPQKSIDDFNKAMLDQQARNTGKNLADLQQYLQGLKNDINALDQEESGLQEETRQANSDMLPELGNKQDQFEDRADPRLEETRQVMASLRDAPTSPALARQPSEKPAKQAMTKDGSKPTPTKQYSKNTPNQAETKAAAKKNSPTKSSGPLPSDSGEGAEQMRQALETRQNAKMSELEAASNALDADLAALEELLGDLNQSMDDSANDDGTMQDGTNPTGTPDPQGAPPSDRPSGSPLDQLADVLNSEQMRAAQEMAARAAQSKQRGQNPQSPTPPTGQPAASPTTTTPGSSAEIASLPPSAAEMEATLKALDPETRMMLLKMQPRVREELLQGLREEGPEGYQKFIRNYYQRLARVRKRAN